MKPRTMRIVIALALFSTGITQAQVWNQIKKKAQKQIDKTTQPSSSTQPTSSDTSSSGTTQGTTLQPSGSPVPPPPGRSNDLYYFCVAAPQGMGPMRNNQSFSKVFPAVSPAPLVATMQFAQYLADKYQTPIFLNGVACTDVQRTEEFSAKRRQEMIDITRKNNPAITETEEDWTFTDRPTIAQSREAGDRMSKETKIFPSGSGGQPAEDAAVQATPEYKALVAAEPENARRICEGNEMLSSFYNCSFSADIVKDERQKIGGTVGRRPGGRVGGLHPTTADLMGSTDLSKCLQPDGIKGYAYKRAMASLYMTPSEERQPTAQCTADKFEADYTSKRNMNIKAVDNLFANDLTSCHTGRR